MSVNRCVSNPSGLVASLPYEPPGCLAGMLVKGIARKCGHIVTRTVTTDPPTGQGGAGSDNRGGSMGRRNIFWLTTGDRRWCRWNKRPGGDSAAQKRELWERWRRGQSSNEIGRAFAKLRGSIYKVLSSSGGIEPRVRRRSRVALSLAEREEISRGLAEGRSMRAIAAASRLEPNGPSTQPAAAQDAGLPFPSGSLQRHCCVDRLSPRGEKRTFLVRNQSHRGCQEFRV